MGKKKGYNVANITETDAKQTEDATNAGKIAFTLKDYDEIFADALDQLDKQSDTVNSDQEKGAILEEDSKSIQQTISTEAIHHRLKPRGDIEQSKAAERTECQEALGPKVAPIIIKDEDKNIQNRLENVVALKSPSKLTQENEAMEMGRPVEYQAIHHRMHPCQEKLNEFGLIESRKAVERMEGQDVSEPKVVPIISKDDDTNIQDRLEDVVPLKSSITPTQQAEAMKMDSPKAMKFFGTIPRERIASAPQSPTKNTEEYTSIDLEESKQSKLDDCKVKKPAADWYKRNLLIVVSAFIIVIIVIIIMAATRSSAHNKNKGQPPNVTQSQHNDEILPRKGSLPPGFIPDFNDEEETVPHTANQATTSSFKDMGISYSKDQITEDMSEHPQTIFISNTMDIDSSTTKSFIRETITSLSTESTTKEGKKEPPISDPDHDYSYEYSGSGLGIDPLLIMGDTDELISIPTNTSARNMRR